jgi:hypothetical protein
MHGEYDLQRHRITIKSELYCTFFYKDIKNLLLAIINDQIRSPIKVQNGRKKQTFDTYAYTCDIVPLVLAETCFAGHTFEYKWKTKQKAQSKKCNAEMRKGNTCKGPSNHQIWSEHRRGHGLGPPRNRPREDGRETAPPRCGCTRGAAAPQLLPPELALLWWLHGGMQHWFTMVSLFSCAKPIILLYKYRDAALVLDGMQHWFTMINILRG